MRIAGRTDAGGPAGIVGPAGVIVGVLILIGGLIAGYAGQSLIAIGAPADVSVTAGVISNSGGFGLSQPVRVRLEVGVVNSGDARVRVVGGFADTLTSSVRGLTPSLLEVPAGTTGQLAVDLAVTCTWPSDLTLPTLRIEEPNGEDAELPLSGRSALTEACARGVPLARPVNVVSAKQTPAKADPKDDSKKDETGDGDELTLELSSPSGRPVEITRYTAGGVTLRQAASTRPGTGTTDGGPGSLLSGTKSTTVSLAPPTSCPPQWLAGGLPSSIEAQLRDGATPVVPIGRLLPAWLLATACPPDESP